MKEAFDWIYSIVIALFLAMVIHIFLFVPTRVFRRVHDAYAD